MNAFIIRSRLLCVFNQVKLFMIVINELSTFACLSKHMATFYDCLQIHLKDSVHDAIDDYFKDGGSEEV